MAVGDYPIDYSVRGVYKNGGSAPEGHPKRCQHKNRFKLQCKKYAMIDVPYCKCHGGGRRHKAPRNRVNSFYRDRLGVKLKDMLGELENSPPDERLSLLQEIDVARLLVNDALELFSEAVDADQSRPDVVTIRMQASAIVRNCLDQVSKLVQAYAKAEALAPGKLTAVQMQFLMNAITRAINEVFQDDPRVSTVMDLIDKIKLPNADRPIVQLSLE